jgi:branched-chain amino acid transport system substrate-binding protein
MKRRVLPWITAAALAAAVAAAGLRTASGAEPFEINVLLSLSGPAAFIGKEELTSLQIIEKLVNQGGGIRGREIKFNVQDDQSNPQVGVQLANAIIAKKVPVIVGPTFTAVCSAVLPLVRENGPVMYCLSPGIHPVAGGYAFSATVGSGDMAIVIARFIREHAWNRVAIISSTDASGADFERGFDAALQRPENKALQLVAREHFAVSDVSVNAQMARIKAANPQVMIGWTAGTGFGVVLHGYHDVGLDVPVVGGNGNMIFAQLAQYTSFLPKELYFPGVLGLSIEGTPRGPVRDKQSVYFREYAKIGAKPDFPSNAAWDPTWLVLDGFKKLGFDASAEQMRDFIRSQHDWAGIDGVYDFRDPEQRGIGPMGDAMFRYDPGNVAFVPASKPGGALR